MRIVHLFRSPVGGLFRHVRDLATRQAASGHEVGILCDSTTGGDLARRTLRDLQPRMQLGIVRLPIPRLPGPADLAALRAIRRHLRATRPAIVHGHGAKGGLHARLAASACGAKTVYTAHGGSLHYSWTSPHGALFLTAERWLLSRTSGLVFVCDFERRAFRAKVGAWNCPHAVIHNGLAEEEFSPRPPAKDARDFLFLGELRRLKGVDVLIDAIALLHARGRHCTALIVGEGPDRAQFEQRLRRHGLGEAIAMPGAMPAARAFPRGRVMAVPSRAESFPYVVLEALAAGKPVIASRVGGIGEMLREDCLVPPDDPQALADKLLKALDARHEPTGAAMAALAERFGLAAMSEKTLAFYESLA